MPGKRSRYSEKQTAEWQGRIVVILAEAESAMTIDEIKARDLCLVNVTSQKIAKILNHLIDMGFCAKEKGKTGRMIYKCLAIAEKECNIYI